MKLTVCLSASLCALLAASCTARADTPNDSQPENPYANLDPDGVPLAVVDPHQRPTVQDVTDMQKQTEQEQRQRDWLLLDYEDVERTNEKQTSNESSSTDVYVELSQNKELARLAGLTPLDPLPPTPPPPRASPGTSAGGGLSLRPEAPPTTGALAPLVSPWSPASAAAATPYFITAYSAPLPSGLAPTVAQTSIGYAAPPAPAEATPTSPPAEPSPTDTIDLQTPGMVAAKDNPIPGTPDLSLDSLPGQNADDTPPHPANDNPPQLPQKAQVMDEAALHVELSAHLKVPNPVAARAASQAQATVPVVQPVPVKEVPMPVTQQPQLSPVHAPVPNPYDILNR